METSLHFIFWGLWTLVQTLGQSELILRLPSIVAMATILWVATRFAFFSMQAQSAPWISVVLLTALIIDRVQLFYATEARVYAFLQLCHLLGWFQVHALLFRDRQQPVVRAPSAERLGRWLHWALWMITTVVACYLHYVAVLIVGVQWCVLFVCLLAGGRYVALREMVLVTCVSGLLVLPLFPGLGEIWNRRSQWTAFAGDASITSLQRMFPWFAWLVPTGVSLLVCRLQFYFTQPGCNREATSDATDRKAEGAVGIARVLFWASACFVPVLLIWLITFLGWAPIVHRRYAIGCAIPLVLCCVFALGQWCTPGYRWLAIAGTCTWLVA